MKQYLLPVLSLFLFFTFSYVQSQPCTFGSSGGFPCAQINLQAQLDLNDLRAIGDGNDIWGWTDPSTNKEYALIGLSNGTAFVDVSDPQNPELLGNLATHTSNSSWRDIKVIGNYAYIVSEASGHGLQVFDLTRLRHVPNTPVNFTEDGHMDFGNAGRAHNIVGNPESGFVYLVGTSGYGSGGMTAVDLSQPTQPQVVSNYGDDGYTHDAQCVIYRGPDTDYIGQEICIGLNEDEMVAVDYTDKDDPTRISRATYPTNSYVHQGWLTDDHRYLLVNDETDEGFPNNTRTYIFDLLDLDNPNYIGVHVHTTRSIDHNLYVKGNYAYLSNYRSGLRIMKLDDIANATLNQTAFFDVDPNSDSPTYNGSWSNYPYFKSGNIIVSSIEDGLFVVKPTFPHFVLANDGASVVKLSPNQLRQISVDYNEYGGFSQNVNLSIESIPSDLQISLSTATISADGVVNIQISANSNATPGSYHVVLRGTSADGTAIERLAFGIIIDNDQPACPSTLTVANAPSSIPNGTYQASTTLTSFGNVQAGDNVIFKAGQNVTLLAGFVAQSGSTFRAFIEDCGTANTQTPPIIDKYVVPQTSAVSERSPSSISTVTPNPAIDRTRLEIRATESAELNIHVVDLTGQLVKTIQQAQQINAGNHALEVPVADLKAGIYFINIQLGEQQWSEKLVVVGGA
jgi:choice-of-anchor B domain-containing protein